jgi:hypothetical protein
MKRTLIYLLLFCFGLAVSAQPISMESIFEPKLCGEIFHVKAGTEGNQFYNDDWATSDIQLSSGEMVLNKKLKYDMLLDEVIWLQSNGFQQVKLEKHFIDGFNLKNQKGKDIYFKRIRSKLSPMPDSADIFVEVLIEKTASLYVFRTVRIEGEINNINGIERYLNRITPEPKYLLILPDHQTIIFKKISRHGFIKMLPEKYKSSTKEIIQQNHLSVRNENDLSMLVGLIEK